MGTNILHNVENGVGWLKLNRPQALNALSIEMVESLYETLVLWKSDPSIALVCITGEGAKGFCAGGDMRYFYDHRDDNVEELAYQFFSTEYRMNELLHKYPKPILVYMDGVVMGGGVGLSIGAKERIVTEKTKWAMPEMNIGFFPDVGGSYFLNQMPGYVGTYLALTGAVIKPEDVIYIGAADHYMESNRWEKLVGEIQEKSWTLQNTDAQLRELLDHYGSNPERESALASLQTDIDQHFSHATIEEILQSLEKAANSGDAWAGKTKSIIESKSPTSLKVTLRQLQKGRKLSLEACFDMELVLGVNFMKIDDFYEGVRSVLVDKDRNPAWSPNRFEAVTEEQVESYFENHANVSLRR